MDLHLRGKSVLITGASKGIGAATAEAFAEEGSNVHLAARSTDAMQALAYFQLPTILAPIAAPNPISVRRDRPRHITMFPGGGSLARARYPPNLAILIKY